MSTNAWREDWSVLNDGAQDVPPSPSGDGGWVALTADPQQVERVGRMPADAVLAEAPMGDYDVLELAVFDHPVARVRFLVHDDAAAGAVGDVERVGENDLPDDAVVPVLVEAALDEAWQGGAETVTTLVPAERADLYLRAGWREIERVAGRA